MIAKKNPKLNFENKRGALFQLGVLALAASTLAAFTFQSPEEGRMIKVKYAKETIAYEIEPQEPEPIQKIEPLVSLPQTNDDQDPSFQLDNQQQVDLNQKINETKNTKKDEKADVTVKKFVVDYKQVGTAKVSKEIVDIPDIDAKFVGGYLAMQEFISKNVNYPELARELNIQGTVYVQFVVDENGEISRAKIIKSVDKMLDREAERVVKLFPQWVPGMKDGENVPTWVQLPIRFTLNP